MSPRSLWEVKAAYFVWKFGYGSESLSVQETVMKLESLR